MTRTDFNKYLLSLNLSKETFEMAKNLAMTMVSNGMSYEECAKIVAKNIQFNKYIKGGYIL